MTLGLEQLERAAADTITAGESSTLDQIRDLYREAEQSQHLDLSLPGKLGKLLKVRYGVTDDEIDVNGKTAREINLDALVAACECLLIREGDRWEPLTRDGEPVRFDENLSEMLDFGVPSVERGGTARDVALKAFSGAPSPHAAVAQHITRLSRWMVGGTVDEEQLLGES